MMLQPTKQTVATKERCKSIGGERMRLFVTELWLIIRDAIFGGVFFP